MKSLFSYWKDRHNAKKTIKDLELTAEEQSAIQEAQQKGNQETVLKIIAAAQERQQRKLKDIAGVDVKNIIPEIGLELSWIDIVNHIFRVLDFDRSDTIINQNNDVIAKSLYRPYGYLLVESPILNQKARLPIIHKNDFWLAASVLDEPKLKYLSVPEELLVTYSPKHFLPTGHSGSPHHVLHYVIAPSGTLDSYYSFNNDIYMAKPDPRKLFGAFVYEGEIRVQLNPEPKLSKDTHPTQKKRKRG